MSRLRFSVLLCALGFWHSASISQAQPATPGSPAAAAQPDTAGAAPAATNEPVAPGPGADGDKCSAQPEPNVPGPGSCEKRPLPHVDQVPDVASLKTPESPAFMTLGLAPSEIQRPTTPTGLATSLANGFSTGGSLALMQNAALEFSPFWLFPHRRLSYEQVLSQPERAVVRNLSISAATSPKELERKRDDGSTEKVNYGRFGFGARTTLWPGTPTQVAQQCLHYIKRSLEASAEERNQAVTAFMTKWAAEAENREPKVELPEKPSILDPNYDALSAEYDRKIADSYAANADYMAWARRKEATSSEFWQNYLKDHPKNDARFDRCMSDLHSREGFMAEVAGAYAFSVPKGDASDFKKNALQTTTGWLTAGFVVEDLIKPGIEGSVIAVFRVQRSRAALDDPGERALIYDTGARIATAFTRFGIAFEGTHRWRRVDPSLASKQTQRLWRIGLSLDYRLAGGMWLTGTFGKDFGSKGSTPLLALANFQWNFGLDRSVKPDTKVTQ